jgi:hypothetical protein
MDNSEFFNVSISGLLISCGTVKTTCPAERWDLGSLERRETGIFIACFQLFPWFENFITPHNPSQICIARCLVALQMLQQ